MIEEQVMAVRNEMLQIILRSTSNVIARYIAKAITDRFLVINKGNATYSRAVDIEYAAQAELPRYLEAGILGGDLFIKNISKRTRLELGKDYDELVEAYEELARIRRDLCSH